MTILSFPEHYFENEIRCGFNITAMMKHFWAAQMEVLAWIDSVCSKYGIRYIMCFGSLLGTVRHKGYIPWDDDIDIAMLRADYNRFMEVVPSELPQYFTTKSLLPGAIPPKELILGIGNGTRVDTSRGFLNRFHGCPYAVTIDLFAFDRIPSDPEQFAYQDRLIRLLDRMLMLQWDVDKDNLTFETSSEYNNIRKTIESELDFTFTDNEPMTIQILRIMDLACSLCEDCGSNRVENREQMLYYGDRGFLEEHFTDRIFVPYEKVLDVPIPRDYDSILSQIWGDYHIPAKFTGQHPYPSYRLQREVLYNEYKKRGWQIPDEYIEYDENGKMIPVRDIT